MIDISDEIARNLISALQNSLGLGQLSDEVSFLLKKGTRESLRLATGTLILTILLELCSLSTVRGLLQQPNGSRLYRKAWLVNVFNHYILGTPVYLVAVFLFVRRNDKDIYGSSSDTTSNLWGILHFIFQTLALVLIHAVCYYNVHKAMHQSPFLYQFHSFHHRFKTFIPPVSANAVSAVEYLLAYVVPFAVASACVRPEAAAFQASIALVSLFNLIIHTPPSNALSHLYCSFLEPICVSPFNHSRHHRELKLHYAAPTLNIDWIVHHLFNDNSHLSGDDSSLSKSKQQGT